jgi:hypothetical protein
MNILIKRYFANAVLVVLVEISVDKFWKLKFTVKTWVVYTDTVFICSGVHNGIKSFLKYIFAFFVKKSQIFGFVILSCRASFIEQNFSAEIFEMYREIQDFSSKTT